MHGPEWDSSAKYRILMYNVNDDDLNTRRCCTRQLTRQRYLSSPASVNAAEGSTGCLSDCSRPRGGHMTETLKMSTVPLRACIVGCHAHNLNSDTSTRLYRVHKVRLLLPDLVRQHVLVRRKRFHKCPRVQGLRAKGGHVRVQKLNGLACKRALTVTGMNDSYEASNYCGKPSLLRQRLSACKAQDHDRDQHRGGETHCIRLTH